MSVRASAFGLLLSACAVATPPSSVNTPSTAPTSTDGPAATVTTGANPRLDHFVEADDYGADLVEVYAPPEPGPWPVVVLFHGGGWMGGTVDDVARLANELAARGVVVFDASYRTLPEGGAFPSMVDDVACAIAYARAHASRYTTTHEVITAAGHSAGAHLAALATFGSFGGDCRWPLDRPADAFIGLAGPYDPAALGEVLTPFFGARPEENPEAWTAGTPATYAGERPEVRVLLIHGDDDDLVPLSSSEDFAAALEEGGHRVELAVIEGETHGGVIEPVVVNDLIVAFLG